MSDIVGFDINELEEYAQSLWHDLTAGSPQTRKPSGKYAPRSMSTLKGSLEPTEPHEPLIPAVDPYTLLPKDTPRLPDKRFRVLLADPAWKYSNFDRKDATTKKYGAAAAHYDTLTVKDMMLLPVETIADPMSSVIYMWTTTTHLPQSLELLKDWEFEYRNIAFTWIKTVKSGKRKGLPICGMGYNTRQSAEFVVCANRGKMPERFDNNVNSTILAPRDALHSRKPDEIRERIFRLHGDVPRIEMFAREAPVGWDVWGNQAPATS